MYREMYRNGQLTKEGLTRVTKVRSLIFKLFVEL